MRDIIKSDAPEQTGAKKKKRTSRKNLSLYYVLVLILVTVVGVILSLTVLFKTDKIIVNGQTPYNDADIIEASGVKLGENIIRADYSEAEEKVLGSLLYVETVSVKKKFPTTVVITVTETKPCYNIETQNGYLIVSQNGKVLDLLVSPIEGLLTVYGIDPENCEPFSILKDKESNKADILIEIKSAFDKSEIECILSVDLSDKYDISLNYDDRIEVMIGNSANIGYKIEYAKSVFESNKIGSNAEGVLMIDENGEGHFVSEESMQQYEENKNNAQQNQNDVQDDESVSDSESNPSSSENGQDE
ncbi:MAG: FtsQ-type POTRA domain-containing protein [Oscillospiraceae bacterium]|nr:FtsQ-type POTRA domain-containing protein [Oscillospiraceae bacterium]